MSEWTRERLDLIKKTVCPQGIGDDEFALFIEQCKRSGLDPLLKEAFCVKRRQNIGTKERPNWIEKYEFQPAETGMLSRSEEFPDHRGVTASAVYSGDSISIDAGAGVVVHSFVPGKARGNLLGAWAKVEREGRTATVVWLDLAGYQQSSAMWGRIPSTMMEKCARVAALRKAYPRAFGGLYIKEEMPQDEVVDTQVSLPMAVQASLPPAKLEQPIVTGSRTASVKAQLAARRTPRIVDVEPGETEEQATQRASAPKEAPKEAAPKAPPVWKRIVELGALFGKTEQQIAGFAKGVLNGRRTGITETDLDAIQQALEQEARFAANEPPPHPEEDAVPF